MTLRGPCCRSPVFVLLIAGGLHAAELPAALQSIRNEDLKRHTDVLASDTLEGREAGSRGGRAAGIYVVKELQRIGVPPAGERGHYFQEFGNEYRNILAVLPGRDPRLKDEYILLGAHYDHVGYGSPQNSYGPFGRIHNGADDNASGTAGLLELCEALSELQPPPKRSVLFAWWDAEEKDLLGSQHWLASPTVPVKNVRLVVNLDMIGRLREDRLTVYGARSATGLRRLVSERNAGALGLDFNWDITRDSDHYPFAAAAVPFLYFYTSKHEDYHRPSDDVDKLNLDGMREVVRLVLAVVHEAAERDELAPFRERCRSENEDLRRRYEKALPPVPSRLGIAWDAEAAREGRVVLTQVMSPSAAERAGLRVGDRIVEFGGHRPGDFADFRALVHAAQSPVTLRVQRPGAAEPVTITAVLDGPPRAVGISWRPDDAAPDTALVVRVLPGSPADLAGIRVGDRVHTVGGQTFASSAEFGRLISRPESPLELQYERAGSIRTARLTLVPGPTDQTAAGN